MSTTNIKLTLLGVSLLLGACESGTSPSGEKSWDNAITNREPLNNVNSMDAIKIPVLQSKAFEKKWGKPSIEAGATGHYRLTYSDPSQPFNRLLIYGSPKPFPKLVTPPMVGADEMVNGELTGVERPQEWRHVTVMGQNIRYFKQMEGGGADGDYYSTVGISLVAPNGKTGHYRLVVEAGDNEAPVRNRMSSVKF